MLMFTKCLTEGNNASGNEITNTRLITCGNFFILGSECTIKYHGKKLCIPSMGVFYYHVRIRP